MSLRFFTSVGTTQYPPPIIHFEGMPPSLTAGTDHREKLPWPKILVIEPGMEGGYMLYRYTDYETCAGDTWHQTIEDAKHQARYEYGELTNAWQEIPQDIEDPVAFAFQHSLL